MKKVSRVRIMDELIAGLELTDEQVESLVAELESEGRKPRAGSRLAWALHLLQRRAGYSFSW